MDSPQEKILLGETDQWLEQRWARVRSELKLRDNQFLVGISQIACGADMVFTRVCRKLSVPQRIFLPQHREQFLAAAGTDGKPDFTEPQREEAEALLESGHIFQERVVASFHDRTARFEDTNFEIMRISDAMVCMLRSEADGKPGGTHQLLERAIRRGLPTLEIRVAGTNGRLAIVKDQWHNLREDYQPPGNLPAEIASLPFPPLPSGCEPIPRRDEYCGALRELTLRQAGRKQRLFKIAAAMIIVTHIAATLLAALALSMHDYFSHRVVVGILLVELALLVAGNAIHFWIHHSRTVQAWAISRVISELLRSLDSIGTRHLYLEHLFRLHLPYRYRPLLRTLSVLHLKSTWPSRDQAWQPQRDRYIRQRFEDPVNGQPRFFEQALHEDRRTLKTCQRVFLICSVLAMLATLSKVLLLGNHDDDPIWLAIAGGLAVALPVLAVGGLSWAAAVDCEARVDAFGEVQQFLKRQRPHLEQAASGREFDRLLLETETVLLGEITNWYSRRSSKGVS